MKYLPSDARLCRYSVDRGWIPIRQGIDSLSKREMEVLKLLAGGMRRTDVARKLGLAQQTVTVYTARIFAKLNLSTIPDLIHYALFHGVVENRFAAKEGVQRVRKQAPALLHFPSRRIG